MILTKTASSEKYKCLKRIEGDEYLYELEREDGTTDNFLYYSNWQDLLLHINVYMDNDTSIEIINAKKVENGPVKGFYLY